MQALSEVGNKQRLRFFSIRVLISGVVLLFYIWIWRPIRVVLTEHIVYPQIERIESTSDEYVPTLQNGALHLKYQYGEISKELQYRPEFGFFFLVALLSLLFVTDEFWHYCLLIGIHLSATAFAYVGLMMGAIGTPVGFIITDAISGYLTPALSLALVPLIMKRFFREPKN